MAYGQTQSARLEMMQEHLIIPRFDNDKYLQKAWYFAPSLLSQIARAFLVFSSQLARYG